MCFIAEIAMCLACKLHHDKAILEIFFFFLKIFAQCISLVSYFWVLRLLTTTQKSLTEQQEFNKHSTSLFCFSRTKKYKLILRSSIPQGRGERVGTHLKRWYGCVTPLSPLFRSPDDSVLYTPSLSKNDKF